MGRYEIDGRVVLITGAGKGIGRDVARRLGPMGAKLAQAHAEAKQAPEKVEEVAK